jgi:hypothetical protein
MSTRNFETNIYVGLRLLYVNLPHRFDCGNPALPSDILINNGARDICKTQNRNKRLELVEISQRYGIDGVEEARHAGNLMNFAAHTKAGSS